MKKLFAAAVVVFATIGTGVSAQAPAGNQNQQGAAEPREAMKMTPGEVRKIDRDAGKITLRHEAIASLDMPPMTMVFRVQDPKLIDNVKPGDKIRFSAEKIGGQLTVTEIEVAR